MLKISIGIQKKSIAANVESERMLQTTKKDLVEENPAIPEKENGENAGNVKDTARTAQIKENTPTKSVGGNKSENGTAAKKTKSPKTADEADAGIWIVLMMLGASAVIMHKKEMI